MAEIHTNDQVNNRNKNKNIERLGTLMSDRMKQTSAAAVPTTLELASVNGDLSITPASLGVPIPAGEYWVPLTMRSEQRVDKETSNHYHYSGTHDGHTSGTGAHTHTGGSHDHRLPPEYRALSPGDVVLLAWCGNEPVVVTIVVQG